jgi:hypothetical protein
MMYDPSESESATEDFVETSASEQDAPLAHKETQAVNRSKLLVYLVLFLAASAAGTATYFFLTEGENSDFEVQVCSTELLAQATIGRFAAYSHLTLPVVLLDAVS